MASSRQTRSRESLATAASTAAISSGSGGSGMYSLAPAWIAATAARASLEMPQATIGTWMCSASSRITRSRMSRATSTSSRSAPLPPRSTAIACSIASAWVTEAPLSIAILVAVVSWPFNVPTMRSRIFYLLFVCSRRLRRVSPKWLAAFRLDDFRQGDAELVFHQHYLATRHQAVVDVDVDGFTDAAVQLQNGAGAELQQFADVHLGTAEHGRDLHRHVEHGLEVGRDTRGLFVLVVSEIVDRRGVRGVEVGERYLCGGVTHGSVLMAFTLRPDRGTPDNVPRVR